MRYFGLCSCFAFLVSLPARAQIILDSTLGTQATPNLLINGVMSEHLDGGVVNAPMGRVEIGAVSNTPTQVRLSSTTQGWTLGYEPPYARCQLNNIPFFFIISFIFSQLFLIKVIRHPAHAVKSMYWKNNILFGCLQPSFQGFADDEK